MPKLILLVLLVAVVAGGGYFYANYDVDIGRDDDGNFRSIKVSAAGDSDSPTPPKTPSEEQPPVSPRSTIRIATFNLAAFNEDKLANHRISDILVSVLPQFDIVAVQDIRAINQGVLVQLVERINATGAQYDYAVGPDVQRGTVMRHTNQDTVGPYETIEPYSAFLFDKTIIEIDRSTVTSVKDTADRFRCDPLIALFRVRGPEAAEAFTFKLINVHTDARRAAVELDLLDDVFRAVRNGDSLAVRDEGRNEDDVILLGDFGTEADHVKQLAGLPGLVSTIGLVPTTIGGMLPVDNILLDGRATTEFTGRSEVFDLIGELDLSLPTARALSEHLPVWAEFSRYEGGQAGHVAAGGPASTHQ
ncbi:MAG: endonuclease/exonuclease/phosphatase [Thermoguttaceae bacterium]